MTLSPNLPRNDNLLLLSEVSQRCAATQYDIAALIASNPETEIENIESLEESLSLLMSAAAQLKRRVGEALTALKSNGA